MLGSFSVHFSEDFSFGENRETLVQPKVFEVLVGHEVAGPAVSDLVGDHVRQGLVAGLDRFKVVENPGEGVVSI